MASRVIAHVRANAIAYVALFVALGGVSAFAAGNLGSGPGKEVLKSGRLDPGEAVTLFNSKGFVRLRLRCVGAGDARVVAKNRSNTAILGELAHSGEVADFVNSFSPGETSELTDFDLGPDVASILLQDVRGRRASSTTLGIVVDSLGGDPICDFTSDSIHRP